MSPEVEAAVEAARAMLGKHMGLWASLRKTVMMADAVCYSEEEGGGWRRLVEMAQNGDREADAAFREAAARWIENGHSLPEAARAYASRILRGQRREPKRRGKGPYENRFRDYHITMAVIMVSKRGFDPTRNAATRDKGKRESACSIVTMALNDLGSAMAEEAIEGIWKRTCRGMGEWFSNLPEDYQNEVRRIVSARTA